MVFIFHSIALEHQMLVRTLGVFVSEVSKWHMVNLPNFINKKYCCRSLWGLLLNLDWLCFIFQKPKIIKWKRVLGVQQLTVELRSVFQPSVFSGKRLLGISYEQTTFETLDTRNSKPEGYVKKSRLGNSYYFVSSTELLRFNWCWFTALRFDQSLCFKFIVKISGNNFSLKKRR